MKTNKSKLFALLALGGLMALSPIARADDAPAQPVPSTPAPDGAAKGHGHGNMQNDKIFAAIKATDDQKEKLKGIFKDRREKLKALTEDTAISQEDRAAKRKDINKDINAKVKDVISADQYEEYLKFQKENGRRNRKNADQPAATTPPADSTPKN